MSDQKLIMEGWRDFLNKFTGGDKELDLYEDLALWTFLYDGKFDIILYIPSKFSGQNPVIDEENLPTVVAYLQMGILSSNKTPCIPDTWQVKYTATAEEFQKKGLGSMMYEIAATYAKLSGDGGITSDHVAMTSDQASRRWNKLLSSPNFEKRETDKGSDTFDYSGKETPNDPNDDCVAPKDSKNTVDHSVQIKNDVKEKIDKFKANHKKYLKFSKLGKQLNHVLLKKASEVFNKAFANR